nr:MAG TPA: hypothetical protein [Caudoviricetes sp.]
MAFRPLLIACSISWVTRAHMVALPAQIECCERERRLTDSNAGMLAHGNYCQAIYSPILTASALRWKKTRLATAPSTVTIL